MDPATTHHPSTATAAAPAPTYTPQPVPRQKSQGGFATALSLLIQLIGALSLLGILIVLALLLVELRKMTSDDFRFAISIPASSVRVSVVSLVRGDSTAPFYVRSVN